MSDAENPAQSEVELPAPDEEPVTDEVANPYEDLTIPPGAVVEPGTSLVNETGTWRETRPKIRHEPCTGCGLCATFCPDMAIKHLNEPPEIPGPATADRKAVPQSAKHRGEQQVVVDYRYCKGCGICAEVCPLDVIERVPEVK